jgi:hypothetical protein
MAYARGTEVAVERSQREIENLVRKAGARTFYRGEDLEKAFVAFDLGDRRIMFELPMPQPAQFAFSKRNGRQSKNSDNQVAALIEQAQREKWRALAMTIKAKLVSAEAGIETIEEAFLAQVVMTDADGRSARFAKFAALAIKQVYERGLPALPAGAGGNVEPRALGGGK